MPITGNVLSLIQTDTGRILAGTGGNFGRLYRSDDNGLTWTESVSLGDATTRINALAKDRNGNILAAVDGSTNTNFNGVWRGISDGTGWHKVKSHPNGTGYLDIASFQQGSSFVAVGHPVTLAQSQAGGSPVTFTHDSGQTWTDIPTAYYRKFMSVASTPDLVLPTYYPNEPTSPTGGQWFLGVDNYYTEMWGVGRTGASSAAAVGYGTVGGGAGISGLDMAAFLYKNSKGSFYRKALWAVKSHLDTDNTEIWQYPVSESGSFSFTRIATIPDAIFNVLYVDPHFNWQDIGEQRTIWAGANGSIYVSYNSGLTWAVATDAPVGQIYSFVRTTSGVLIAGGASGEIYRFTGSGSGGSGGTTTPPTDPPPGPVSDETPPTTVFLGRTETIENQVYVANKMALSNVTHVVHYNGSTYENLQFSQNPPYEFLGSTLATGKAVYFGSQTNNAEVPGGTFSSLVFNLSVPLQDATIVWEYYNGSAWASISVRDSSDGFKLDGSRSVHWHPPSTWTTTTVDGITGYWIRARVSAVGASPQAPEQDERFIYTALLPYVEIAEGAVGGDLPAIARIQWHNRADDLGSTLGMEIDRVVCGLRTVDRGQRFQAYLNVSDVQAPFGVTVTAGTSSAWSTAKDAPTTRALTISYASAPLLNVWQDLAKFTLENTVARDYYGSYRAFVRCYKSGATSNSWQVRLQVKFGSGGGSYHSKVVFPNTLSAWEILDIGQINLPTTQIAQQSGYLGDELSITIQGKCTSLNQGLELYDLILIPVDEWAVDAHPPKIQSVMYSQIKSENFLDIDSITNPKSLITVLNRNASGLIVSRYQALNNGPAILQSGKQQRLWFVVMATTGVYWYSYPSFAGTVRAFRQQRYLSMRGTT